MSILAVSWTSHLYRNPKIYKRSFKELKHCVTALQKHNWDNTLFQIKVLDLSTGSSVEKQRNYITVHFKICLFLPIRIFEEYRSNLFLHIFLTSLTVLHTFPLNYIKKDYNNIKNNYLKTQLKIWSPT